MAETDYPLAAADNNQDVANPPALQNGGQLENIADDSATITSASSATVDTTEANTSKPASKTSAIGGFFHNGEILRRLIMLGFVVLFVTIAILGLVSLQSSDSNNANRALGRYTPQEIGKVLDFLDQEGFDYKLSGGDTILVPNEDFANVREQMLRRGIAVPAEKPDDGNTIIMSDGGFGVSQRLESERIKHGRELQLARAIERIDGIDHATVLLAIPKENVFARQKNRPSAAVVVTLKYGAFLSPENVNSIRFMVASSVQNLLTKDVSVTDQNGRLLSSEGAVKDKQQDRLQKEFEMRTMREAQYRDKLDSILAPMLGYGNYSAEVDVTIDTTIEEETTQIYNPDSTTVRSETLREKRGSDEKGVAYGVPGSLSNQPPANAVIPQQLKDGTANGSNSSEKDNKESREAVRNYEVDTTIRHTIRPTNRVSRLTVSVAVDYLKTTNSNGQVTYVPRPQSDLDKIADLVRGGLGLNDKRGDFVKVETVSFPHADAPPPEPWWKQDAIYRIARIAGAVLIILVLIVFVIRPLINKLIKGKSQEDEELDRIDYDGDMALDGNDDLNLIATQNEMADQVYSINRDGGIELPNLHKDKDLLKAVRTLVSNEPELSSEVVRDWIGTEVNDKKPKQQG